MSHILPRSRAGWSGAVALAVVAAGIAWVPPAPAVAIDEIGDPMTRVPVAVLDLRKEARRVWTDSRPVVVTAWVEQPAAGGPLRIGVETTFLASVGVIEGHWVGEGDALPQVSVERRRDAVPMSVRQQWERQFATLIKFDWSHLTGEWLQHCGLPRAEALGPGESIYLKLEARRRTPVLVMRYSEGVEACQVDDRGTVYPFEGTEL